VNPRRPKSETEKKPLSGYNEKSKNAGSIVHPLAEKKTKRWGGKGDLEEAAFPQWERKN